MSDTHFVLSWASPTKMLLADTTKGNFTAVLFSKYGDKHSMECTRGPNWSPEFREFVDKHWKAFTTTEGIL